MVPGRHFGIAATRVQPTEFACVMPKCRPGTVYRDIGAARHEGSTKGLWPRDAGFRSV